MEKTTLYQRIKERRKALGLTQDELALKLGYKSRSSINKIEMGENDIPQSKVQAFAEALDTTPAWLMGWETDPVQIRDENGQQIYLDEETREIIDNLRTRPEMRILFSATKNVTKEDILTTVKIIEALKNKDGE